MATSVLLTTTSTEIHHHLDRPISPATITVKGEDRLLNHQYYHDTINDTTFTHSRTDDTNIGLDHENNPLSFLSLPPEVRNQIYTHLFANTKLKLGLSTTHICSSRQSLSRGPATYTSSALTTFRSISSQQQKQQRQRTCGSFCTCSFPYGIMHTCRLLRSETSSLLLSNTTLEISSRIEKLALLPDHFLGSVKRVVVLDAKQLNLCNTVGTDTHGSTATTAVGIPAAKGPGALGLSRFQSLKMLEVRNISVWCQYYEDSYLMTPEADECMFNLAMFNLRRFGNGNVVVKLCEDAERGFEILLGCQFVGNSRRGDTLQAVIDVDTRAILQKSKGATIRSRNAWAGFY